MDERPRSLVVVGASAGGVEPLKRVLGALPATCRRRWGSSCTFPRPEAGCRTSSTGAGSSRRRAPSTASRSWRDASTWRRPTVISSSGTAGASSLAARARTASARRSTRSSGAPRLDFGRKVVAVVLSGSRDDGAAGSQAVAECGGCVKDEATSEHFGMPGAAILAGGVDEILSLEDIGPAVVEFAGHVT